MASKVQRRCLLASNAAELATFNPTSRSAAAMLLNATRAEFLNPKFISPASKPS
jgi:hypothetical protein